MHWPSKTSHGESGQIGNRPRRPHDDRHKALVTLLSSAFISLLAVSILNVSIPSFTQSLQMSAAGVQWTMSGYALSFGLVLVPAGRLGDAYGRRRWFIVGNALFIVAATGGGLAVSDHMLIVMRLIEGFAAATISPQVMGLIQELFTGGARARAFGMFGMVVGVATAIGPALGGVLIALLGPNYGWRAAFLLNVPICIAAIIAARKYLPAEGSPKDAAEHHSCQRFDKEKSDLKGTGDSARAVLPPSTSAKKHQLHLDLPGIIILGASVLCLMLPFMSGANSFAQMRRAPWFLIAVSICGFVLFFWWERFSENRQNDVILPRSLQREPSYVIGTLLLAFYFAGWSGLFVVYTLYLQEGLGLAAWAAGLMQLPLAIGSAIFSPLSAKLVMKRGRWLMVIAASGVVLCLSGGILTTHLVPAPLVPWVLLIFMFGAGACSGLYVSPAQSLSLVKVPVRIGATASGAAQTVQRSATAMGTACTTLLFYTFLGNASGIKPGSQLAIDRFTRAFTAGCGTAVALLILASFCCLLDALVHRDNPLVD